MAKEKKSKNPTPKQSGSMVDQDGERIKINGEYIRYNLYSKRFGWITSHLGDDPKVIFDAIDGYYFEYRKKINAGKMRSGTPFDYYITKQVGDFSNQSEVLYVPGSRSKKRRRYEDDDDDDDFYGEYDYSDYVNY